MPYTRIGGNYNYSAGIPGTGISSYIVNTWEIEASVYVKLLGAAPTLYLRLFQSAFYYFLFVNVMKYLTEQVVKTAGSKCPGIQHSYVAAILPLISTYYSVSDKFQNTGSAGYVFFCRQECFWAQRWYGCAESAYS